MVADRSWLTVGKSFHFFFSFVLLVLKTRWAVEPTYAPMAQSQKCTDQPLNIV